MKKKLRPIVWFLAIYSAAVTAVVIHLGFKVQTLERRAVQVSLVLPKEIRDLPDYRSFRAP